MHALVHSYIPHGLHKWPAKKWSPKMSISKFCLTTSKAKRGLGRSGNAKAIAIREGAGVPRKYLGAISCLLREQSWRRPCDHRGKT